MIDYKNKLALVLKKRTLHFPFIISLSHQKGGVGKSTLAYNIADAFRILGFKVKIIDATIQSTCINLNKLRKNPFLDIEKVLDKEELNKSIYSDNLEILIIDTDEYKSILLKAILMISDITLAPTSNRNIDFLSIKEKVVEDIHDTDTNYILLNKIHPSTKYFKEIEEIPKIAIFQSIIRERTIYDKSLREGRTIFEATELKGFTYAKNEILNICYELIEKYLEKGKIMNKNRKETLKKIKIKDLERFSKSVRFPLLWKEEIEKHIDYPIDLSSFIVQAIKEKMEREEMNTFIG